MSKEVKRYKDMLPIGSVVRLEGGERYLMIYGRIVCAEGSDKIYDYVSCPYPEGIAKDDDTIFFNREAIEQVLFIGFQDEQELRFREEVLDQLGELAVVNGELVSVDDDDWE